MYGGITHTAFRNLKKAQHAMLREVVMKRNFNLGNATLTSIWERLNSDRSYLDDDGNFCINFITNEAFTINENGGLFTWKITKIANIHYEK